MDIKSAIILITSASSALGSTLATHFVKLGAKVILCDRDQQGLVDTYWRCHALSDQVAYFHLKDFPQKALRRYLIWSSKNLSVRRCADQQLTVCALPSLVDENLASSLFSSSRLLRLHCLTSVMLALLGCANGKPKGSSSMWCVTTQYKIDPAL